MKHASLFSGIGGPDLAAEWMGWENVFHCEWNEFGKRVLKYYWPNATSYDDITKTDFTIHRGTIDVLTGGFPCQPYSVAGKQKGKEDERHLWPEMLRAIREVAPIYVVGENVGGLVSWNGGMVFHEVQTELENEGYEVWPVILPAASVNAPHKRDRIFFIAYSSNARNKSLREPKVSTHKFRASTNSEKQGGKTRKREGVNGNRTRGLGKSKSLDGSEIRKGIVSTSPSWSVTNSQGERSERTEFSEQSKTSEPKQKQPRGSNSEITTTNSTGPRGRENNREGKSGQHDKKSEGNYWETFPTQSPICDGDDGLSSRLDRITFSKWRKQSIMAGGNAIVPQVIHQIFKAIEQHHCSLK